MKKVPAKFAFSSEMYYLCRAKRKGDNNMDIKKMIEECRTKGLLCFDEPKEVEGLLTKINKALINYQVGIKPNENKEKRSWEALIFRLNYIKAVCRKNAELHKYSLQRVSQLYDYANKTFPQELYEVGAVERYTNTMLSFVNDPKIRRMKISITK